MTGQFVADDVKFLLTTSQGPGFSHPAVIGGPQGGYAATSRIDPGDSPFTNLTGEQAARPFGVVDYACIMIWNATASGCAMLDTTLWLPVSGVLNSAISVALDPNPPSLLGSSAPQAATALPGQPPSPAAGPWVSPSTTPAGGLLLGIPLAPGYVAGFWLQRLGGGGPARPLSSSITWQVECDIAAPVTA